MIPRDRGSDIRSCLTTVGRASLKINKFFDDKEPIDTLIPSLSLFLPILIRHSFALLSSFLLRRFFFALAVMRKGVTSGGECVCVGEWGRH